MPFSPWHHLFGGIFPPDGKATNALFSLGYKIADRDKHVFFRAGFKTKRSTGSLSGNLVNGLKKYQAAFEMTPSLARKKGSNTHMSTPDVPASFERLHLPSMMAKNVHQHISLKM